MTATPFQYRTLLGWINDISTPARSGKRWPIIDFDEQTLRDYQALFPFSHIEPVSGEFDFEPLMGEEPGPPIYLDRLQGSALADYRADLRAWSKAFARTLPETEKTEAGAKIVRCVQAILQDIDGQLAKRER